MRFSWKAVFLAGSLAWGMVQAAPAAVIHVPGDYPTIQEAIQHAANGDIVEAAAGTYKENIDFLGKAVTVRGVKGPYHTVLDGSAGGSVVTFANSEGNGSVLEGFRLSGGTGTEVFSILEGGGIYCLGASPVLRNLVIQGNTADQGGGLYAENGTPVIEDVVVEGNHAQGVGGGMLFFHGGAELTACRVQGNSVDMADGGGIYAYGADLVLAQCFVSGNTSAFWGGGIAALFGTDLTLKNTVVTGNTAQSGGGGVTHLNSGVFSAVNCTFYGNEALGDQGGGLQVGNLDGASVVNSIFWNDHAPLGAEMSVSGELTLKVDHSDVEGGAGAIYLSAGANLNYGAGNITAAPLFVDTAGEDFHLFQGSPGIDGGDGSAPGLPDEDFEGDPRANGLAVDMGADEHYLPYFYFHGVTTEGESFELKFMGDANAVPVYLFIGSGIMDPPVATPYGDWYLMYPLKQVEFPPLPASGFVSYPFTMPDPLIFPPGTSFPFQALVGSSLTPPKTMTIK